MNVYPFVEAEQAAQRNVARACALLEVSRAAYYQRSLPPSTAAPGRPSAGRHQPKP